MSRTTQPVLQPLAQPRDGWVMVRDELREVLKGSAPCWGSLLPPAQPRIPQPACGSGHRAGASLGWLPTAPRTPCLRSPVPAWMGWQHPPAARHGFGRGTEGKGSLPGPPAWVLTASKGQSVPARLRWESEWHWRRRLCRFCRQRGLSGFAQDPDCPHPPPQHPAAQKFSC